MEAAPTLWSIKNHFDMRRRSRTTEGPLSGNLLAIVFSGPWSSILTDVAEYGGYLDARTGADLDVYFAGVLPAYSRGDPREYEDYLERLAEFYDPEITMLRRPFRPLRHRGHVEALEDEFRFGREQGWFWSPRGFNDLRVQVENDSDGRWRFSGNSDLVLVDALTATDMPEPEIDWESVITIALDAFGDRFRGRWFGEVVETLMLAAGGDDPGAISRALERADKNDRNYGGSPSSRILKYLVLDGLGPWAVGDIASRIFR